MIAHSQTVEDGMARWAPAQTLHFEGTEVEFMQIEMIVRRPCALTEMQHRLVIRASQYTNEITADLEKPYVD